MAGDLVCFSTSQTPADVDDLFNGWIKSFPKSQRNLVLCGAAALYWILWKIRNHACFNNKYPNDPVNVIYMLCYVLTG
jgi:hypothetical protein